MAPKLKRERRDQKRVEQLSPHYQQILEQLDKLPDSAVIPVPIAAIHDGTSRRTIKRIYPRVKISEHGVRPRDVRFTPEADIRQHSCHVRFVPKADSCTAAKDRLYSTTASLVACFRWNSEAKYLRGSVISPFSQSVLFGFIRETPSPSVIAVAAPPRTWR
jgi:hypothetical protein